MNSKLTPLVAVAAAALATGCVTRAEHDTLQREFDATRAALTAEVAQRDQRLADANAKMAADDAEVTALGSQIAQLEQQLVERQAEVEDLEAKSASLLQQRTAAAEELAKVLKTRARLKSSVDRMVKALSSLASRKLAAERRVAQYREIVKTFRGLIDAGALDVRIVDGRMVLAMPMDILFATGRADLSADGKKTLATLGTGFAAMPERRFQVEGHTDNVPIHNKRYASNWELASARALVVVRTLLAAGVTPQHVSAASYSEYRPTASNETDQGRALNRRIEIVVVPDLSLLPGYDELNRAVGAG